MVAHVQISYMKTAVNYNFMDIVLHVNIYKNHLIIFVLKIFRSVVAAIVLSDFYLEIY